MQAIIDLKFRAIESTPAKVEKKSLMDHIRRIRNGISKHVTIENDAIFNDPKWPHLWS